LNRLNSLTAQAIGTDQADGTVLLIKLLDRVFVKPFEQLEWLDPKKL
jgi:hypothetical protein